MTVTPSNVNLGSCDVTYLGVDLGSTKGGVEVDIKTEKHAIKVDQTGETPLKEIIIGTMITVKVPLAENDLSKLGAVLPQSVTSTAASAATGFTTNAAGYAIGVTAMTLVAGTGTLVVGDTFVVTGHTTSYKIVTTNGTTAVTFVQTAAGVGGLVTAIAASAIAITVTRKGQTIELRTGVNIDLSLTAGLLNLHPTGGVGTDNDFSIYLAAPVADFKFKYMINAEKIYEVTFTAYPDPSKNYRLAAFGAQT